MRKLLAALLLLAWPAVADMYPDANNAKLPEAQDNLGITRSVEAYGAKCDGTTNDSVAFQAAIDANPAGHITLPKGNCLVDDLQITKSIHISGQSNKASRLVSPAGRDKPIFTVQVDTVPVYPGMVMLDNFAMTATNKNDPVSINKAHGLYLKPPPGGFPQTEINLINVTMEDLAGSCLYTDSGIGNYGNFVVANNFNCILPRQYGIYANTAGDWLFYGGQFYGAALNNIFCSGCAYFQLINVNVFSAGGEGIHLFDPIDWQMTGGGIDRNQEHGINIDIRSPNRVARFNTVALAVNGTKTNDTYSDMYIAGGNIGTIYLDNVRFADRTTAAGNRPLENLRNAGSGYIYATNTTFAAGDWQTPGTLAGITRYYRGTEPNKAWTPTVVGSAGGTAAVNVQAGNYVVSDGWVRLTGQVATTSLAGLTGSLRIGGLPVGPFNGANQFGHCSTTYSGWTAPAGYTNLAGMLNGANSTTQIMLFRSGTAGGSATETAVSEWAAGSSVIFSCDYRY